MKVGNYSSLADMMRRAPVNAETVNQFRDAALTAVDQAVDVFFRPEREVAEGQKAYDDLTDVELGLRAYSTRNQADARAISEALRNPQTDKATVPAGELNDAPSALPNGKKIVHGKREVAVRGKVDYNCPRYEQPTDVGELAKTMEGILPLFGSVAMSPGPLSVSLKDHLKETLQWSSSSKSSFNHSMEEESFKFLGLLAGHKFSRTSGGSSSSSEGKAESTTVDERVLPGLQEIRMGLDRLGYVPSKSTHVTFHQDIQESDEQTLTEGALWWRKEYKVTDVVNRGELKLDERDMPATPDSMRVFGANNNQGLTHRTAGSDLVDLVEGSALNGELMDKLRTASAEILDRAVSTLFNNKREVADGRRSYDELTNLSRALSLATSKGPSHYGNNELAAQVSVLNKVTPLYACVAMVPGEMSASVKTFAKEVMDFKSHSESSAGTVGGSESWNVLALGASERRESGSMSSESTASMHFETSTVDEKIMPALHKLRVKLQQLDCNDKDGMFIPEEPKKERDYY